MKRTIAIFASLGVLVAAFWAIYAAISFPASMQARPVVWILAQVTCPIAFASVHFHFGVKLYWVMVANALTYAIAGGMVELARHQLRRA